MGRPVRTQLLGDQIVTLLRNQIIHGEIPQGSRIVEGEIAERYDVSRGPVRDAFTRLLSEGLLEKKRQGCVVRGVSEKDVWDIYEVRVLFEESAVSHVISHLDTTDWTGMEQSIEGMHKALESGDLNQYALEDLNFHDALIQCSHNARIIGFWSTIMPIFSVMLQVTNAQDSDLTPSFDDHVAILESLKSGENVDVKSLINRHLEGSLNRMIRALQSSSR
ncbi:MAG: GntR family transcriptional regulator [Bifidobacterium sp.]|uniref:GntR family transcriptional regulator n=1 Tax=Bifidobacterium sp. TaxID=41200 RepID=UPI0039E8DD63